MINKIGLQNSTSSSNSNIARKNKEGNPNFKGVASLAIAGMQACERMPMVNVAVIDMISAILPRTVVESMTNWFAGFEAFRRESSGLIVNCMIPGAIALGIAKLINPAIMPKKTNMAHCWGDRNLINKITDYYKNTSSEDRVQETFKTILGDIEGFESKNKLNFKDILGEESINEYAKKLKDISLKDISNKEMRKEISEISKDIIDKTKIAEHISVGNMKTSSVSSLLEDSVKFFREFQRTEGKVSIEEFAKKSKKLVGAKSLLGLGIILPLAASMQYINRWITGKVSGTKGAPIYEDFARNDGNIEEKPKAKEGLLRQKFISIGSMLSVSLLSMMKMPSMKMLEFKGIFPTMDQARVISTATFASRMAAADDKNELAEATVRDIATYCGLYFFGDYAAKGMATYLQKKTGVSLLNDTKPLKGDESIVKRFIHWVKDVNIKSSEEVVSKTQKALNGAAPTKEQAEKIAQELKHAKYLRGGCQAANLGVSLALLGLVIPIFTRKKTKKKHEQALKLAQEEQSSNKDNKKETTVTPLDVKYSSLTAGFRAEK